VGPLDLGTLAFQTDMDLTVDLVSTTVLDSTMDSDLTEDSDSVVDSDAGVAALVLAGVGAGIRGGAGDHRGGVGAILPTHIGE
jgi:hypothetical protein